MLETPVTCRPASTRSTIDCAVATETSRAGLTFIWGSTSKLGYSSAVSYRPSQSPLEETHSARQSHLSSGGEHVARLDRLRRTGVRSQGRPAVMASQLNGRRDETPTRLNCYSPTFERSRRCAHQRGRAQESRNPALEMRGTYRFRRGAQLPHLDRPVGAPRERRHAAGYL